MGDSQCLGGGAMGLGVAFRGQVDSDSSIPSPRLQVPNIQGDVLAMSPSWFLPRLSVGFSPPPQHHPGWDLASMSGVRPGGFQPASH